MDEKLLEELRSKDWHVCMSGGGAGGIIEVGGLERLEELEINLNSFSGVSTGALNSAGMGYRGLEELKKIWFSLTRNDQIFKSNWFTKRPKDGWQIGPVIGDALMNSEPLRKILEEFIPENSKPSRPCSVTYVDLKKGRQEVNGGEPNFREATLASASVPMWTNPINGSCVDGGVQDITPLKGAIQAGHENIIVLLASPWHESDSFGTFNPQPSEFWMKWSRRFKYWKWMSRKLESIANKWLLSLKIASASVDMLAHQNFVGDIKTCLLKNEIEGYKKINILVFSPASRETPTNKFDDPEMRKRDFEQGKQMIDNGPILRSTK